MLRVAENGIYSSLDRINQDYAQRTIKDLLSVAGSPSYRGAAAVHVLARLGAIVLPEIKKEIYRSPVGFRSVRVLGRMLLRVKLRGEGRSAEGACALNDNELLRELEKLLLAIDERPPLDPYPARSFYIEALRWAPNEWDWVSGSLIKRALSVGRPVRERVYAALVALQRGDKNIGRVISSFQQEGRDTGEDGLVYASAVLQLVGTGERVNGWLDQNGQVPTTGLKEWPPTRSEADHVNQALDKIDQFDNKELPTSVRDGTKTLLTEALLTLDGTRRRRACDVLVDAQVAGPATLAVSELLDLRDGKPHPPRWLQEHAAFVVGYLQQHDAIPALTRVVTRSGAYDPTVVHAAAWGIGDICGHGGLCKTQFRIVGGRLFGKLATRCIK